MQPQTRYAKSGDVHIAYQVVGDGPRDLVFVPGAWSHCDLMWEDPAWARFAARLATFSRVIIFDKRGTGLSDRSVALGTLEQRMEDVHAVMDAVGSKQVVLFGPSEGAGMSILFSASYPERTIALILYGADAKGSWAPDYPWEPTREQFEEFISSVDQIWGTGALLPLYAPSRANDPAFKDWWTRLERASLSPAAAIALVRCWIEYDVRDALRAVHVPTLILHRRGDLAVSVETGRHLARNIPGAKYVELAGEDHLPWIGDADALLDEVEEFVTGVRHVAEPDRVLATILFTDIVGSTERAAELGDLRWHDLLDSFYAAVRKELERHRGKEVNTAGDSFLATFDGPARAIRCARAIRNSLRPLGIQVRSGLHTGECELMGDNVGGIAVHIGARVGALAGPDEVFVSSTVKDLVAGSGISFKDRGTHDLKGVPDAWRLFQVGDS